MRVLLFFAGAILLIALGFTAYNWWETPNKIAPLVPSLPLVGVIDFNSDNKFNLDELRTGDDLLLVLDKASFDSEFIPMHPELASIFAKPFDLINYDLNHDGTIDSQNPIWPYLYVVVYSDDGNTYQVRHLNDTGIHAILTPHLTPHGNHRVLLSDGDTRTLYEVNAF